VSPAHAFVGESQTMIKEKLYRSRHAGRPNVRHSCSSPD
jgi:hypothetical protein